MSIKFSAKSRTSTFMINFDTNKVLSSTTKLNRREFGFLVALAIVALVLRGGCVDCYGLWQDEVDSVQAAQQGIDFFFNDRFGLLANQTPWHYLLVWLTLIPADPTTTTLFVRLPSLLAGALLPVVAYLLGKDLFGQAQGAVACVSLALAPTMLDYSQEVRPYMQVTFCTLAAVFCLLRAERTGSIRYWMAFAGAAIGIMLLSYTSILLVMPAIGLLLLWSLRNILARDKKGLVLPLMIAGLIGLVGGLLLLDAMQHMPRSAPLIGPELPVQTVNLGNSQLLWFTRVGISENIENTLSLLLLMLSLVGAYAGFRHGGRARQGVMICLLLIALPVITLAVLSSSSPIYPRYLLFVAPFYLLLVANGAVWLGSIIARLLSGSSERRARWVVPAPVFALFAFGALNFYSLAAHTTLTYRPDFRGAATYLASHVHPEDTIIFINTPAHGLAVSDFYWHGRAPAQAYDAHNPLLFAKPATGRIYWVIMGIQQEVIDLVSPRGDGWGEMATFERVLVLSEPSPGNGLVGRMEDMVNTLHTRFPDYKPLTTILGTVLQAKGDTQAAASTYLAAGSFFPLGLEYQRTAEGFEARGNIAKAWQEAMMSKHDEPARPEIHQWLAQRLKSEGYAAESEIESEIARLLSQAGRP